MESELVSWGSAVGQGLLPTWELPPALGEIALGSPGLVEGCSEALAYLQVVTATTHAPPNQFSGCGAVVHLEVSLSASL